MTTTIRMPYIRALDDGALSEDEDACASHGFANMMINLEKRPSLYHDDMELNGSSPEGKLAPQAPSSPLKKRKAFIKALGADSGNFLKVTSSSCRKQSELSRDFRANSMDETMEGSSAKINDAASVVSASAFSMSFIACSEMPKNTNDEETKSTDESDETPSSESNNEERLLTQAERDAFFAPPTLKTDAKEFKPTALTLPAQPQSVELPLPA